ALAPGGVDGVVKRLAVVAVAPAVVGDGGPVGDGVVEGGDGVGDAAAADAVEELQVHQLHFPVHAGDADAVVALGPDDAGDVGAVVVVVRGVVVVLDEVPADDVVDVAIAVLVGARRPAAGAVGLVRKEEVASVDAAVVVEVGDLAHALVARVVEVAEGDQAVAVGVDEPRPHGGGDLALVDPDVLVQVGVAVVGSRVGGRGHGLHAARGHVPGLGGADVGAGDGARALAGVAQGGLGGEARVVGDDGGVDEVVRLGAQDVGVGPEPGDGLLHGEAVGHRDV